MKKVIASLVLIGLLISACDVESVPLVTATVIQTRTRTPRPTITYAPTHTPSLTPTPTITLTPTPTSTLQPALIAHEWWPERVLISIEGSGGDGGPHYSSPPPFVLYADGNLFVSKYDHEREQIFHLRLSRKEICQHLNTIDQTGFLDYDPTQYNAKLGRPSIMGAGATYITINSWKKKFGRFYGLGSYLYRERTGHPVDQSPEFIPPSLRNVYNFLAKYDTKSMGVYEPDRLGFWINRYVKTEVGYGYDVSGAMGPWPFKDLSLRRLFAMAGSPDKNWISRYVVLEGEVAQSIFDWFDQSFDPYGTVVFEQGETGSAEYYMVFARPILPYELPGEYGSEIPAPGSTKPNFKLTCYPSDGIMPIPTP